MAITTIWRLPEVLRRTGLSRSTIYEMIGKGDFPQQVKLGPRAVGWIAQDIVDWIETRIDASRSPYPIEATQHRSHGVAPSRGPEFQDL